MQQFQATVRWQRGDQVFSDNRYSRAHTWQLDGGLELPVSSSPLSVPLPMSDPAALDPEEALVAALSSCHMLFFLSFSARAGFVVDSYCDHPLGTMDRNGHGKIAMTRIALRPQVIFAGARLPSGAEIDALHHEAHQSCYIANSITADVVVEKV